MLPHRPARRSAFTLVELLVVIGIIALLISILLPALTSARRQAAAVKCAAHLREMGNAFAMYGVDNKGWWPVVQHDNYLVGGLTTTGTGNFAAFWWNFVEKYYNRGRKLGVTSTTGQDAGDARNSLVWGCPAWQGFYTGALGEMNRNMPGYGMSWEARTTPAWPGPSGSTGNEKAIIVSWLKGKFFKQSQWIKPSERCLLADAKFYSIEQTPAPSTATDLPGQESRLNITYGSPFQGGESTFDAYRHVRPPSVMSDMRFNPKAKAGFNILYCDGHVATVTSRIEGYKAVRQRFPG